MVTADTNVVVRLLTKDDPGQYQKALTLFAQETIFLTDTVLLETAWVLQHSYNFEDKAILFCTHFANC